MVSIAEELHGEDFDSARIVSQYATNISKNREFAKKQFDINLSIINSNFKNSNYEPMLVID
jgi:hypothetical protein